MTKWASKDVGFFLVGPYSVLGATSKIEDGTSLRTTETPILGVADEEWFSSGTRTNTLTQEGWFDDDVGSMHEMLVNLPTDSLPMAIAPNGNVISRPCIMFAGVQRVGYNVQLTVGEVTKANGEYGLWGDKEEGIVVAPLAARTTAGNTDATYADLLEAGADGGAVYWFVPSLTLGGYTSVTGSLRHSDDHITFVQKTAMTALTEEGAERKTFTGAINRYVSLGWTWAGSGSDQSATCCMGVYANPAP